MYAQAIGVAARMAAREAKEIWWKKLLKESASIAAREAAKSGMRRIVSFDSGTKNKPLQKKLEELNKMHKDGLITSEEHAVLRKRIIDSAGPADL